MHDVLPPLPGRLAARRPHGPRQDHLLGRLHLHERLEHEAAESLRFDPLDAGPLLRPTGAVQALRDRAYRTGQRFRPTPRDSDEVTEEAVEQEAAAS